MVKIDRQTPRAQIADNNTAFFSLAARLFRRLASLTAQLCCGIIRAYQRFLSPLIGPRCRFYPSCSTYTLIAIQQHGLWRGARLSIKRLSKCHPGHPGGIDEVPANTRKVAPCCHNPHR